MKALRIFAAALVAAFAISCGSASDNVKVDVELPSQAEVDSVSYLIGINFGSFIKGNNFAEDLSDLNMAEIKKGMVDFLSAEGSPYDPNFGEQFDVDPNEMTRILNDFLTKKQSYKAAKNLAERYLSYMPHLEALEQMSTLIFDTMKRVHGLSKRERLLLQVAAILHDCGKYISFANGPMCSYDIIMASEIIGLTHMEREIVANTVLFNTLKLVPYEELSDKLDREGYITVAKLSAILRVSNAMDRSHKQKFKNVKVAIKDKELVITIETLDDIALEKALFAAKTEYFESVFSIKPVVKVKRVYM